MIGYVTVGTNDLAAGAKFYDALFELLGAQRYRENDHFISWATSPDKPIFGIIEPLDGKPATAGNGVSIAFPAESREQVDRVYKKALELGGQDAGPPSDHGGGFYAGYFRDLDGHRLNAFVIG